MARLVVVSNRAASTDPTGAAAGGLAVVVSGAMAARGGLWFAWSGRTTDGQPQPARREAVDGYQRVLIDLDKEDFEGYYVRFSNQVLWPLLHYRIDLLDYDSERYGAYLRINETFARRLLPLLEPDDLVWVHDYHLIPLGSCLRRLGARQRIGFFLHTPFPVPEVFRVLPVHREIARVLLSYDLIGVQTPADARAMASFLQSTFGHGPGDGHGSTEGHGPSDGSGIIGQPVVGVYPVGIDVERVHETAQLASASPRARTLAKSFEGRTVMIGVDRLDYTKGLLKRLEAVELFLSGAPRRRRDLAFVQISPVSRGDVREYQELRRAIEEKVGHINGKFGEVDRVPVRYTCRSYAQRNLFALYRLSSIGLVTPFRDGMNLVAKEYVACQRREDPGVLVLSCFAGAAQEMAAALIVNPYDPEATAKAIATAMDMPLGERRDRHQALLATLARNDLESWRDRFLRDLETTPRTTSPSTSWIDELKSEDAKAQQSAPWFSI